MQNKIKYYRKLFSLTQEELAKLTGIKRETIAQIETGKRKDITVTELICFANAFKLPVSAFLDNKEKVENREILFRAKEKITNNHVKKINWVIDSLCLNYDYLLELHEKQFDTIIPNYEIPYTDKEKFMIHMGKIAESERNRLNYHPGEGEKIFDKIKKFVTIFEIRFSSEEILGFIILRNENNPIIVVNASINPNQKNFIAAHEYGHMILHGKKTHIDFKGELFSDRDLQEIQANEFAAELLYPRNDVLKSVSQINEEELIRVMDKFCISRSVAILRWKKANIIDEMTEKRLREIRPISKMKDMGITNEETRYWEKKLHNKEKEFSYFEMCPKEYIQLAKDAYFNNLISYKKLAEYCYLDVREILEKLNIKEEEHDEYFLEMV